MGNFIDLTGKKFGRLTIVETTKEKGKCQGIAWKCSCDCGKEIIASGSAIRSGNTKSCGCYKRDNTIRVKTKHSGSESSEYDIWVLMKGRCYNINNRRFSDYGGRGIIVCDRWKEDFRCFLDDMGERPSKEYSLERINNDGNYEPLNCKWATNTEQAHNQRLRKDNTSKYKGISWSRTNNKWQVRIQENKIRHTIGFFKDLQEAIEARQEAEQKYWGKTS